MDVPRAGTPSTPASPQWHEWGYGRTAADVIHPLWRTGSVGVGAIEILHPSPGPPSPTQNPTDKMQTQTPQPNNPTPLSSPVWASLVGALPGVGWRVPSPFLKQSKPCLKSQNNQKSTPLPHAKSPEIPSGVVQSKQLRVQSMFNQCSIKTPPPQSKMEHPPWAGPPRED